MSKSCDINSEKNSPHKLGHGQFNLKLKLLEDVYTPNDLLDLLFS